MDPVRKVAVYFEGKRCGVLERTGGKYYFEYDPDYLSRTDAKPLSCSLPLQHSAFVSDQLFSYFANLVSEGWLLHQQSVIEKIDARDYLTLLGYNGDDLAGAVTIKRIEDE